MHISVIAEHYSGIQFPSSASACQTIISQLAPAAKSQPKLRQCTMISKATNGKVLNIELFSMQDKA